MHLLDLTHTAHTRVQTGIQVVCRALYAELAKRHATRPITWDRYAKEWRELQAWELANLNLHARRDDESGATGNSAKVPHQKAHAKRSAQWPLSARISGRLRRLRRTLGAPIAAPLAPHTGKTDSEHHAGGGLIIPELFAPSLARYHTQLRVGGPRVAVFHDAIPLKYPELSPAKTVAFYPGYLHSLLQFDGIAANSEDSAQTLRDYFRWLGAAHAPQVAAIPLGVNLPATIPPPLTIDASSSPSSEPPTILSIGSIEGRKNHLALLDAAESLWARGRRFKLHIIGLAQAETGRAALAKITALQAAGRPLRYPGHADLATLEAAYAECRFTVYPSIIEGFGLPVIESLARGRPCICSGKGALGEVAAGGGTLALDEMTAPTIATAIDTLLQNPDTLSRLATEARTRRFRTWGEYTDSLLEWMNTL